MHVSKREEECMNEWMHGSFTEITDLPYASHSLSHYGPAPAIRWESAFGWCQRTKDQRTKGQDQGPITARKQDLMLAVDVGDERKEE